MKSVFWRFPLLKSSRAEWIYEAQKRNISMMRFMRMTVRKLTQVATNASMAAGISGSTAPGPSSMMETKRSRCFSANEPRDPLKKASRRIEMIAGCLKGLVRTIRPVSYKKIFTK